MDSVRTRHAADLTPAFRTLPTTITPTPQRWGIIVATFVLYNKSSQSRYAPPSKARKPVGAPEFWTRLSKDLAEDTPAYWGSVVPLEIVQSKAIADLTNAHYVDPAAKDCEVRLILVRERSVG